jgi:hypothetical protein
VVWDVPVRFLGNMQTTAKFSYRDRLAISVLSGCDEKTIRKFLAGERVSQLSEVRIAEAVAILGPKIGTPE